MYYVSYANSTSRAGRRFARICSLIVCVYRKYPRRREENNRGINETSDCVSRRLHRTVSYVSWVSSTSTVRTMWRLVVEAKHLSACIRLCATLFPLNCRLERNSWKNFSCRGNHPTLSKRRLDRLPPIISRSVKISRHEGAITFSTVSLLSRRLSRSVFLFGATRYTGTRSRSENRFRQS